METMGVTCTCYERLERYGGKCPRHPQTHRADAVVLVQVNIAEARDRYWEKQKDWRDLKRDMGLALLLLLLMAGMYAMYAYRVLLVSWG